MARTLLLIVMLALLPLRMWAAEGMAVRMAHAQAVASTGGAPAAAMPADCPMLAQAQDPADTQTPSAGHCMSCHLCAASAGVQSAVPMPAPVAAPTGPPAWSATRFASADLAPDLRPPIA